MMTNQLKRIIQKHQLDVDAFLDGSADISEPLFRDLFEYYVEEMPYSTAKGRDGDPFEWITYALNEDLQ